MIEFHEVEKDYGANARALRGLTLSIPTGGFMALIGPSGSGKSTALSLINRLIEPTSGRITIDSRDIREGDPVALRRSIGFVFQGIGLFPHLNVAENIGVAPRLLGWAAPDIAARVRELLELVRLPGNYRDRLPRELSGGEQQRVGIARALAAGPKVTLMDEPFAALDPLTRDELGQEYRAIHDRLGLTTIMVTHDVTEALLLADRIAVMRDGALVQSDSPPALIASPADDFVRSLLDTPRRRAQRLADALGAGPT